MSFLDKDKNNTSHACKEQKICHYGKKHISFLEKKVNSRNKTSKIFIPSWLFITLSKQFREHFCLFLKQDIFLVLLINEAYIKSGKNF